jgi:hypothetical protein
MLIARIVKNPREAPPLRVILRLADRKTVTAFVDLEVDYSLIKLSLLPYLTTNRDILVNLIGGLGGGTILREGENLLLYRLRYHTDIINYEIEDEFIVSNLDELDADEDILLGRP